MIKRELMDILRCPACVKTDNRKLTNYKNSYLICADCGRKYPIVDDIPIMLIDEGAKYIDLDAESLEIPPVLAKE